MTDWIFALSFGLAGFGNAQAQNPCLSFVYRRRISVLPAASRERPSLIAEEGAVTHVCEPFCGTWRLVSFEARTSSGEVSYPLGKDAAGYLIYSQRVTWRVR